MDERLADWVFRSQVFGLRKYLEGLGVACFWFAGDLRVISVLF
jgi:hypothetical protein